MPDTPVDPRLALIAKASEYGLRCAVWENGKLLTDGAAAVRTNATQEELARLTAATALDTITMQTEIVRLLDDVRRQIGDVAQFLRTNTVSFKPSTS